MKSPSQGIDLPCASPDTCRGPHSNLVLVSFIFLSLPNPPLTSVGHSSLCPDPKELREKEHRMTMLIYVESFMTNYGFSSSNMQHDKVIKESAMAWDGQPVVLIDTPGFDDTYKSDVEILGIGEDREMQLKSEFWNDMIDKGCSVSRFGDSYDSAWDILAPTNAKPQVLLSDEIAEQHKKLKETEVGVTLSKQLQRLSKDQRDANRRLKGLARRQKNPKMAKELSDQAAEVEGGLSQTLEQMRALKLSFTTKGSRSNLKQALFVVSNPSISKANRTQEGRRIDSQSLVTLSSCPIATSVLVQGIRTEISIEIFYTMFRNKQSKDRIIVYVPRPSISTKYAHMDMQRYGSLWSGENYGNTTTTYRYLNLRESVMVCTLAQKKSSSPQPIPLTVEVLSSSIPQSLWPNAVDLKPNRGSSYKKEIHIERILYLHKISDNRMAGPSLQNLELFASICRQRQVPNVTFVTTMWSQVNEELGRRREKQLCEDFWKELMDKGSEVVRFKDSYESALEILGCSPEEIKARILLSTEKSHEHKHKWLLSFSKLTLRRSRTAARYACVLHRDWIYSNGCLTDRPKPQSLLEATAFPRLLGWSPPKNWTDMHIKSILPRTSRMEAANDLWPHVIDFIVFPAYLALPSTTYPLCLDPLKVSLCDRRNGNYNLAAILYLHRISDNRMAGSPLKNLELFASLCGRSAMPHVVLVTTMWSHVSEKVGAEREEQLKTSFWHDMMEKGCSVRRFEDTHKSAWDIIKFASSKSSNDPQTNVLISTELVDRHKKLKETQAGTTLNKQLEKLIKDQKEANKRLRTLANSQGNQKTKQELTKRVEELEGKITQTTQKMRELKLPIAKRLLRLFSRNSPVSPSDSDASLVLAEQVSTEVLASTQNRHCEKALIYSSCFRIRLYLLIHILTKLGYGPPRASTAPQKARMKQSGFGASITPIPFVSPWASVSTLNRAVFDMRFG
ncbi:12087_t:CDS:10, partial [Acaulospora colombiana]